MNIFLFIYRQHMEQAHKGTQRNFFTCTQCGWRFEKEIHMLDHMSSVHGIGDQQPTIANDFPQHFMFSEETTTTENRSNINPELRLNCKFCDEKFTSRSDLKRHISEIHELYEGNSPQ